MLRAHRSARTRTRRRVEPESGWKLLVLEPATVDEMEAHRTVKPGGYCSAARWPTAVTLDVDRACEMLDVKWGVVLTGEAPASSASPDAPERVLYFPSRPSSHWLVAGQLPGRRKRFRRSTRRPSGNSNDFVAARDLSACPCHLSSAARSGKAGRDNSKRACRSRIALRSLSEELRSSPPQLPLASGDCQRSSIFQSKKLPS